MASFHNGKLLVPDLCPGCGLDLTWKSEYIDSEPAYPIRTSDYGGYSFMGFLFIPDGHDIDWLVDDDDIEFGVYCAKCDEIMWAKDGTKVGDWPFFLNLAEPHVTKKEELVLDTIINLGGSE